MSERQSKALNAMTVALVYNGSLTILEAQQEYEGEQGAVTPAKSIWLNSIHAKRLRDFLNEQFPKGEA
ncbi:hypothetical protein [Paenibacillus graminis]|uniref:hypothetical protein n=1 Tax=Paenibacillus graminis TaxID=189425 RepID=UPI002DB8648A|nr:hypothetical protein [Paenibacillus graminis]MEC0170843.1 hypothetical protein [Paenibacillus graminis]